MKNRDNTVKWVSVKDYPATMESLLLEMQAWLNCTHLEAPRQSNEN